MNPRDLPIEFARLESWSHWAEKEINRRARAPARALCRRGLRRDFNQNARYERQLSNIIWLIENSEVGVNSVRVSRLGSAGMVVEA